MFEIIKNLTRHSIIYAVAGLLSKAAGFIMIPLYTYYLTTSDYGALELIDLTSYTIGMFASMGIAQAVLRYYYEYDDEKDKKKVISVAIITLWAVSLIVLPGLFFLSKRISILIFECPDYFRMFNIIFVTVVIGLSNQIPLTVLRIEEKSILYVCISLTKLLLTLSLNILFIVYLHMGVMGILISGLISTCVTGIFLMVYILRRVRLSYSFKFLFSMVKYGLPLAVSTFGMFILNFGDRFMLQRLASLSDVGIYGLAYRFGMLPSFLIAGPFMMIWGPKRLDLVNMRDAKNIYASIFTYFCFIQLFLVLEISVLIKDLLILISAPEFRGAYQYVPLILLSYIFNGAYIYTQFGVILEKKTKYLAFATLFGAVLNIAGNYILIPKYQVWGASVATLISFCFIFFFTYLVAQRLYKIPYQFSRLLKMILAAAALFMTASFINPSHVILSLIVKVAIASCFPFSLYLLKFYTPEELEKLGQIFGRLHVVIKTRFGFAVTKMVNLFRGEGR